jgi:regulator of Ty1 transposition protein 103
MVWVYPRRFYVYLCYSCANARLFAEVAQQSKARRKDDFLIAFSPVIAEATAIAYKGATNEIQQKLKRVVEVWRQRQIFEMPIQDAIEARIEGM